jgi:carboxylesterase type B
VVKGKMGLKDKYMDIRWVKEKIEEFGGNKESINIKGK